MTLEGKQRYDLGHGLQISRIINGMWQVSGNHGYIDPSFVSDSMMEYHKEGYTTWDVADNYGPAEDFVKDFRHKLSQEKGEQELSNVEILTKIYTKSQMMSTSLIEESIDLSLSRMNLKSLDLLQFHWWDYNDKNYLDKLDYLTELRDKGKIKHLGLTNFDTEHLQIIADHGLELISNQIQYSIIDLRPKVQMEKFCIQHDMKFFTYGTLCGGFLSEKYLGCPEPFESDLNTLSLQKYKNMIDAWGGWNLFQELLGVLSEIAKKHDVSIANIATRYILDKPQVAGIIIGVRLGISEHISENSKIFGITLNADDNKRIQEIIDRSENLFESIGDCGDEFRQKHKIQKK